MTVKVFVGRDTEGRPFAPEFSHEMLTAVDIVQRLWLKFNHLETFYAVIANLQEPSADLVVISERGIGVMELKHYYGSISCRHDGVWYAGPKPMQAGVQGKGFRNPHEQVQAYAEQIRSKLLTPPLWQEPWLPGKALDWPKFKFHTSVCFTHPDADLSLFEEQLRKRCRPITLPWEDFSVLRIEDIPQWVAALRFEVGGQREGGFVRHRLTPDGMIRIIHAIFNVSPWVEIDQLMPTGLPFAYLTLIENGRKIQVFALDREETTLGRDWRGSGLLVPVRFSSVSRMHARIVRTVNGVFLEDLQSTNGTFLNGERVESARKLSHGQVITLGNPLPGPGVCTLEISFEGDPIAGLDQTETLSL